MAKSNKRDIRKFLDSVAKKHFDEGGTTGNVGDISPSAQKLFDDQWEKSISKVSGMRPVPPSNFTRLSPKYVGPSSQYYLDKYKNDPERLDLFKKINAKYDMMQRLLDLDASSGNTLISDSNTGSIHLDTPHVAPEIREMVNQMGPVKTGSPDAGIQTSKIDPNSATAQDDIPDLPGIQGARLNNLQKKSDGGDVLNSKSRNALHTKSFALPDRRYPIEDIIHARNALSRVAQFGTPEERAKVRAAVSGKYPSIGMDEGGPVDDEWQSLKAKNEDPELDYLRDMAVLDGQMKEQNAIRMPEMDLRDPEDSRKITSYVQDGVKVYTNRKPVQKFDDGGDADMARYLRDADIDQWVKDNALDSHEDEGIHLHMDRDSGNLDDLHLDDVLRIAGLQSGNRLTPPDPDVVYPPKTTGKTAANLGVDDFMNYLRSLPSTSSLQPDGTRKVVKHLDEGGVPGESDAEYYRRLAAEIEAKEAAKSDKLGVTPEIHKTVQNSMTPDAGSPDASTFVDKLVKTLNRTQQIDKALSQSNGGKIPHFDGGGLSGFESSGGVLGTVGGILFGTPPQDSFQATAPTIQNNNWQQGMQNAYGQAVNAQNVGMGINQQQGQLAQQLQNQANGIGPSLAQQQLVQATQGNVAGAASMAASQRGMNPAMARRLAMQNEANANQTAGGQAAQLRLQEQRTAQQNLGSVLGQQQQSALTQQGLWNQMYGQNAQGLSQYNTNITQGQLGAEDINARTAQGNVAGQKGMLSGIFGGAGAGMQYDGGKIKGFDDGGDSTPDLDPVVYSQSGSNTNLGDISGIPTGFNSPSGSYSTVDYSMPQVSYRTIAANQDPTINPPTPGDISKYDAQSTAPFSLGNYNLGQAPQLQSNTQSNTQSNPASTDSKSSNQMNPYIRMLLSLILGSAASHAVAKPVIPRPYDDGGDVDSSGSDSTGSMGTIGSIFKDIGGAEGSDSSGGQSANELGSIIGLIGMLADKGGKVPGRALVSGDSPTNDRIPAYLSPDEIVLPRSVTLSQDPPEAAKGFVKATNTASKQKSGEMAGLIRENQMLKLQLAKIIGRR